VEDDDRAWLNSRAAEFDRLRAGGQDAAAIRTLEAAFRECADPQSPQQFVREALFAQLNELRAQNGENQ
jgi:hypothetical protein